MFARYFSLVMHYNFIKNTTNSLSSKHRTIELTQNQGSIISFNIYMWFFKKREVS